MPARDNLIYFHSIDAVLKWLQASYDPSLPDPYTYEDRYLRVPKINKDILKNYEGNLTPYAAITGSITYRKESIMFNARCLTIWVKESED